MSVAIIGGSVAGAAVSGYMANKSAKQQAAATRDAAAMGAAAADPFADQRGFYQGILRNLYGGMDSSGMNMSTGQTGSQYYSGEQPSEQPYSFGGISNSPMAQLIRQIIPPQLQQPQQSQQLPSNLQTGGIKPVAGTPGDVAYDGASSGDTPYNPVMDFIQNSPDYQFRVAEGQRALERSNAAGGMLKSGNLLLDLVGYGQGKAAEAYNAEINRIMTMAGAAIGSPGVAGQLISSGGSSAASTVAQGQNVMASQLGYGLAGAINTFNQPTTANSMISSQTGYTGGASGVLSGNEFASW